jgi:hypothetical protein
VGEIPKPYQSHTKTLFMGDTKALFTQCLCSSLTLSSSVDRSIDTSIGGRRVSGYWNVSLCR